MAVFGLATGKRGGGDQGGAPPRREEGAGVGRSAADRGGGRAVGARGGGCTAEKTKWIGKKQVGNFREKLEPIAGESKGELL